MALSSECYLLISNAQDLTRFELSETGEGSEGANVSLSAVSLPIFACIAASWRCVTLRRFTAAQLASRLGLLCGRLWDLEVLPHHAAQSSSTSVVFFLMACQYKTASHCPTPPVLSLRHRCSLLARID
jgi:hypothetical protein